IGFNVRPDTNASVAAERESVDLKTYRIIYDAIEDIKSAMIGMLDPDYKEVILGKAEVRMTYKISNVGTIAGGYVLDGKLVRNCDVRVIRDGIVIFESTLGSLKRFKDDVKEVNTGYECGFTVDRFNDIKEGDIIEAFTVEAVKRKEL
ncbi:MAG: EF-Tu/IF-2/RF-3 family GTPase, partial [Clostridiaceae bacterium]